MDNKKIIIMTSVLLSIIVGQFIYVFNEINGIYQFKKNLEHTVTRNIENIEKVSLTKQNESINKIENESTKIISDKIAEFNDELAYVQTKIKEEKEKLEEIKQNYKRIENGLPELVELDDLYKNYSYKVSDIDHMFNVEEFLTSKGSISFDSSDFEFAVLPSTNKIAWIKIGKENSTLNSELIKAWLDEASYAKEKLGYKLNSNKTNPSDYGEYTRKIYKKGDLYFITYFQYIRVQGTYNRHSFKYNFYIKIGSDKRTKHYQLEQYNKKIGS